MATLQALLDQHSLHAPSNRDEDWCFYDVAPLLATPTVCKATTAVVPRAAYYVHFVSGALVDSVLPAGCTLTAQSVQPPNTNNALIQLSVSHGTSHVISVQEAADITIYYDATGDTALFPALSFDIPDGVSLTLRRCFTVPQGALMNAYTMVRVGRSASLTCLDDNMGNAGHVLDFVDATRSRPLREKYGY